MNFRDIESFSSDELKTQRDRIVDAVKDDPDLARRYHQARLDSVTWGEKLAEQGKTITMLQALSDEKDSRYTELKASAEREVSDLRSALEESANIGGVISAERDELTAEVLDLQSQLAQAADTTAKMKAQALRNNSAIADAAKVLNQAISAQAVEFGD